MLFWDFSLSQTTSVGKYWKSCKTAKIGYSESIQTTLVGKYWKSCKTAKIGHSESLVRKYRKSCKMTEIGHSESICTTLVRKYWNSCKTVKIGHYKSIQTMSGVATAFVTIIFNILASDFNVSTSCLTHRLCGWPGSLSGGAFNQLNKENSKVLTILY